ncbi:hypothetical protein Gotur_028962 [Gossypium turneri]
MSEQWVASRIKQKGDSKCIPWKNLKDIILAHPDVDKVSYQVFSENYSPLKEIVATPRRDDILEEKWMAILQNLREKDVEWRAMWLRPDEILYRCGDFVWVPLLGIWRAVGYAPLLVLR